MYVAGQMYVENKSCHQRSYNLEYAIACACPMHNVNKQVLSQTTAMITNSMYIIYKLNLISFLLAMHNLDKYCLEGEANLSYFTYLKFAASKIDLLNKCSNCSGFDYNK